MAEKVSDDLKRQFGIEHDELRQQQELMVQSKQALASKQECIDDLKVEVLLLSSKLSSYQESCNEMRVALEETSKSQKISENTVLILKGHRADDEKAMSDLMAKNLELNNQLTTLIYEKNVALEGLREKVGTSNFVCKLLSIYPRQYQTLDTCMFFCRAEINSKTKVHFGMISPIIVSKDTKIGIYFFPMDVVSYE